MRRDGAAVNAEPLAQLHEGRTRLVQGHQLVHSCRAQKGLSHPNSTHHPTPRVHYRRLQGTPITLVEPARPAQSHRLQGRARVLKLSTELHRNEEPCLPRVDAESGASNIHRDPGVRAVSRPDPVGATSNDRLEHSLELLWSTADSPSRGRPPSLTLDQIVQTAVAVADSGGVDAIVMRTIAERIGVKAMALYRCVPGKTELLNLMLDRVHADDEPTPEPSDWRTAAEQHAMRACRRYRATRGCFRSTGLARSSAPMWSRTTRQVWSPWPAWA